MDDDVARLVPGNLLSPLPCLFLSREAANGVAGVALSLDGPAVGALDNVLMLGHNHLSELVIVYWSLLGLQGLCGGPFQ